MPIEALTEEEREQDLVGYLVKSLYGTRDAAANFQQEVRKFMESKQFTISRYSPCMYHHQARGLRVLVHGDDFVTSGDRAEVLWLQEQLARIFEVKTKLIGQAGMVGEKLRVQEEGKILNRLVRWTADGFEYEADLRHVDIMTAELGLQEAKSVRTPGEVVKPWEEAEEEPLGAKEATRFRGLAARANFLALDRSDIQYSVKELCRHMASPTTQAWKKLKRLGRYLVRARRVVWRFPWQARLQANSALYLWRCGHQRRPLHQNVELNAEDGNPELSRSRIIGGREGS